MSTKKISQDVKISPLVSNNFDFLKILAKTKSLAKRKSILGNATTLQLLCLAEICLNIIRARFKLSNRQKKRMMPFADFIRRLGRARTERRARQLVQKGAGLGINLFPSLLAPIILELARSLTSNKINDSE